MGGFLVLLLNVLALVAAVAHIWLLVHAFRKSAGWGLALLFLSPFSTVIFAVKNWHESRKPFLIWAGSAVAAVFCLVGLFGALGGFGMVKMASQMNAGELDEAQTRQFMTDTLDKWEDSGLVDEEDREGIREMKKLIQAGADPQAGADTIPAFRSEGRPSAATSPVDSLAASVSRLQSQMSSDWSAMPTFSENARRYRFPVRNGYMTVPLRHADDFVGEKVTVTAADGVEHRGTLASIRGGTLTVEKYLRSGTFAVLLPTGDVRKIEVAAQ